MCLYLMYDIYVHKIRAMDACNRYNRPICLSTLGGAVPIYNVCVSIAQSEVQERGRSVETIYKPYLQIVEQN